MHLFATLSLQISALTNTSCVVHKKGDLPPYGTADEQELEAEGDAANLMEVWEVWVMWNRARKSFHMMFRKIEITRSTFVTAVMILNDSMELVHHSTGAGLHLYCVRPRPELCCFPDLQNSCGYRHCKLRYTFSMPRCAVLHVPNLTSSTYLILNA